MGAGQLYIDYIPEKELIGYSKSIPLESMQIILIKW